MEKIAATTGVICIAVFIMGLFYQLGGFEKTSGVIKFVISICVLTTILKSVNGFTFEFDNPMQQDNVYINEFSDDLKKEIINDTQQEIEDVIKKRLEEKNISYNYLSVHILEQNGSVYIDKIIIDGADAEDEEIFFLLKDMTSQNTIIETGD